MQAGRKVREKGRWKQKEGSEKGRRIEGGRGRGEGEREKRTDGGLFLRGVGALGELRVTSRA